MAEMRLIITLAVVAAAVPAQAADQFDLVCRGTKEWSGLRAVELTKLPFSFRLKVDTLSERFCYERCEVLYSISLVTPKSLFLGGFENVDPDNRTEVLDRTTGKYFFVKSWQDDALSLKIEADCTASAFTGFPEAPSKF